MVVEEEGQNLSVGQRSLVSLARALVRSEARIVILDEVRLIRLPLFC
jgi:ATP-binding cassette subfamily C (CFTR/MRP) protein 1